MPRSEEGIARSRDRKLERMMNQSWGMPWRETFEAQLDRITGRYLDEMRDGTQKGVLIARGEIRGMARAMCLHLPNLNIKQVEKDSADRVRSARAREQAAQEGH